jgi:hypothetical protein
VIRPLVICLASIAPITAVSAVASVASSDRTQLRLERIVGGAYAPTDVATAPEEPGLLYIVEKAGRVRVGDPDVCCAAVHDPQAPDSTRAEIAEDVTSPQAGHGSTPIDVTTRHERARPVQRLRAEAFSGVSFVVAPAEVHKAATEAREIVHLLVAASTDIRDVQGAGCSVEREAPGIPQSVCDDSRARTTLARLKAKDLPEHAVGILRVPGVGRILVAAAADEPPAANPERTARVVRVAAVARAHVEGAVRAERKLSAEVVEALRRTRDPQQATFRAGHGSPVRRVKRETTSDPVWSVYAA